MADAELTAILDQGREARREAVAREAAAQAEPVLPPISFDGGVRRGVVKRQETMNGFIGRAANPWAR